jgi:integrase
LSFLKSVLYRAEYDGIIDSNPIRGRRVKKLDENNHRERVINELGLTDDDLRRLVDAATPYLRPILKVALTTGMRQGEILKARWKDANLRLGTLGVPIENAKSKKERVVPIAPDLCGELDSLPRNGEYIFSNPDSGTGRKDVRGGFKAACDAAHIETGRKAGLVFHDLRHIAA